MKTKIEFTVEELNYIFNILHKCPYGEVLNLIGSIKQQFDSQQVVPEVTEIVS
jgi:hypothetical protein